MIQQSPLVSVLMTAYNREKYITEAIESVLHSTYTNLELIISDDCSADNTVNIAKAFSEKDARVKVFVNKENLGDYPNRNRAASYASGEYIKYLDSDDIMYPHCLQVMVEAMNRFPAAGYGLSAVPSGDVSFPVSIGPNETYLQNFSAPRHFDRAPGSSIMRKNAFDKIGRFSGKRMIGDYELWFRLSCYYDLVLFPRDLVWDRQHAGQEKRSGYAKKYELLRQEVVKAAFIFPDCPLNEAEKMLILKKMKISRFKNKLKKLI